MDGYNTVGDSLYFVNPSYGSAWFDSTLKFNLAIGDHNFYTNWSE
jgi:spore germination cell wall hydrolase CwlJ-like protein